MFRFISLLVLSFCFVVLPTLADKEADVFSDPTYVRSNIPGGNVQPVRVPGFAWGGIPLDDSTLYEIRPEKCKAPSTAEIIGEYSLTDKVYLFKTPNGYGVASLDQTLKEIETGTRRKKICPINVGLKISGDIDCKGVRVIKEDPYEGCAFESKIWAHSLNETQAFALVYEKLKAQHKDYKQQCIVPVKRTIKDSMLKF